MTTKRTFTIEAQVERPNLRSAIAVTEQLVEHGYVDFARVVDDADPNNPVIDPEQVDRVAAALIGFHSHTMSPEEAWSGAGEITRNNFRSQARAAIGAMA